MKDVSQRLIHTILFGSKIKRIVTVFTLTNPVLAGFKIYLGYGLLVNIG